MRADEGVGVGVGVERERENGIDKRSLSASITRESPRRGILKPCCSEPDIGCTPKALRLTAALQLELHCTISILASPPILLRF
jgi:hypothetical protein